MLKIFFLNHAGCVCIRARSFVQGALYVPPEPDSTHKRLPCSSNAVRSVYYVHECSCRGSPYFPILTSSSRAIKLSPLKSAAHHPSISRARAAHPYRHQRVQLRAASDGSLPLKRQIKSLVRPNLPMNRQEHAEGSPAVVNPDEIATGGADFDVPALTPAADLTTICSSFSTSRTASDEPRRARAGRRTVRRSFLRHQRHPKEFGCRLLKLQNAVRGSSLDM